MDTSLPFFDKRLVKETYNADESWGERQDDDEGCGVHSEQRQRSLQGFQHFSSSRDKT
jgi:hypothetical protein